MRNAADPDREVTAAPPVIHCLYVASRSSRTATSVGQQQVDSRPRDPPTTRVFGDMLRVIACIATPEIIEKIPAHLTTRAPAARCVHRATPPMTHAGLTAPTGPTRPRSVAVHR